MKRLRPGDENTKHPGGYMGYSGLAYVLAMTRSGASPFDVTRVTGLAHRRASGVLRQFWIMGLIHRSGWIKPTHGFPTPIYTLGPGEDVPAMIGADGKPHAYADMRPKQMQPRIVAFCSLCQAMAEPSTVAELERQSGIDDARIRKALKAMNEPRVGLSYIAGYQPRDDEAGPPAAMWVFGKGKNAPMPAPKPRTRKTRNARTALVLKGGWINTVMDLRRIAGIQRPKVKSTTTAGQPAQGTLL